MTDSTKSAGASKRARVGRPRINAPGEVVTARFRDGTLERIKAVLAPKEKQSDFIRDAVETALDIREGKAGPAPSDG